MDGLKIVSRGMREELKNAVDVSQVFQISIETAGPSVYDCCCFGLDKAGCLSDDRYMVFYNQTETPEGAVRFVGNDKKGEFTILLSALPETVCRLVFSVSIDVAKANGDLAMGAADSHILKVLQNRQPRMEMSLRARDFHRDKSILFFELYRYNGVWKFRGRGEGFLGGLGDLLHHFGGTEFSTPEPPHPVPPKRPETVFPGQKAEQQIVFSTEPPVPPPAEQPIPRPVSAGGEQPPMPLREQVSFAPVPPPVEKPAQPVVVPLERERKTQWRIDRENEVEIILQWNSGAGASKVSLSLGCLYELEDGTKGSLQRQNLGDGSCPDFLTMAAGKESLSLALEEGEDFRNILLFACVNSGASNWKRIEGRIEIRYGNGMQIEVPIDAGILDTDRLCTVASLHTDGDAYVIKKEVAFYSDHKQIDRKWDWNLRWLP